MECPAPILEVARAARKAGDGTSLLVLADDDAFEMDIQSWVRTANANLESLQRKNGVFRALIQLPSSASKAPQPPAVIATPNRAPASSRPSDPGARTTVDCRGMECPAPILEVARAARNAGGGSLHVLATDDAFELDIQSWCRTAKASLDSLTRDGDTWRAEISLSTPKQAAPAPRSPVSQSAGPFLDLSSTANAARMSALNAFAEDAGQGSITIRLPDRSSNAEILDWCAANGHEVIELRGRGPVDIEIDLGEPRRPTGLARTHSSAVEVHQPSGPKRATLLCLHNDKEALLAALLVANGAAAQGMDVSIFFTFWGLNLLRGDIPNPAHKREKVGWSQRLFKWMMPRGPKKQQISQLNFGGMGSSMLNGLMRKKNIMDLPDLLESAQDLNIEFIACTMSMNVMGITKRDLHPYSTLTYGGVATFVEKSASSELSLVF